MFAKTLIAAATAALIAAAGVAPANAALDTNGIGPNGMSTNALTQNGVSKNALTGNGMMKNALTSNGVAERGAEVERAPAIVEIALPSGETVTLR